MTDVCAITDFSAADNSSLFKCKQKITGQTEANARKVPKLIVLLKHFSNFWRTLEKPLINCEINLIFTCLKNLCHLMIR